MLTQSAEYAVRVVVRLAALPEGSWGQAADLADELELPANYLSKLLHQLAAAGVLRSRRGRGGGFRLGAPADRITLAKIVAPFEPVGRYRGCLLGGRKCSGATACEAHDRWKPIADQMLGFLTATTVAQLAASEVPNPRGRKPPRGRATRLSRRNPG